MKNIKLLKSVRKILSLLNKVNMNIEWNNIVLAYDNIKITKLELTNNLIPLNIKQFAT